MQSSGVEKQTTVGRPFFSALSSEMECMVSGGSRVQICFSSDSVVPTGVGVEMALEPIGATEALATTFMIPTPTPVFELSCSTAANVQFPALGMSTSAT